jgi:hypothetical protein
VFEKRIPMDTPIAEIGLHDCRYLASDLHVADAFHGDVEDHRQVIFLTERLGKDAVESGFTFGRRHERSKGGPFLFVVVLRCHGGYSLVRLT